VAALENLSESVAIEHYKRNKPPDYYVICAQLEKLDAARLQKLARRVTPWYDNSGTWLKRVIQLIDVAARHRSGTGIPKGFLDPNEHTAYELRKRVELITVGEHLLPKDATAALAGIAAAQEQNLLRSYCFTYRMSTPHINAALDAIRKDPLVRAWALKEGQLFQYSDIDRARALSFLRDKDEDLRELGRRIAIKLDPLPDELVESMVSELLSGDPKRVGWTLHLLRSRATLKPTSKIPRALVEAVEAHTNHAEHANDAFEILLKWS
jgi:hypothetical protein